MDAFAPYTPAAATDHATAPQAPAAAPAPSDPSTTPSGVAAALEAVLVGAPAVAAAAAPVEKAVVAAVQHPSASTVQAAGQAAIVAEAGWTTSEGQMTAAVVGVATALEGLVSSGAVTLPSGAAPWVLAALACSQAIVVGAYAIGRSIRKVGTSK